MKKKYFLATFLIVLTLSLLVVLLFDNEDNSNNNIKMDSNDTKVSKNQFAIMINNGDGEYVESNSNVFPTNMAFNASATVCTDKDGNKLEDVISFENGKVTVETNKKMYCYLYFDETLASCDDNIGNCLLKYPTLGLNTTMEAGLYRYQGTNDTVNNHICFGTSDKSTCLSDTNKYMYRIIGVNENGQLKLIKKEALNTAYAWHSTSGNTTWPNTNLYKNLNGSYFLSNTTYVTSVWGDKIATTTWKYGDNSAYNTTASDLYTTENEWTATTSAKISLMYEHDYVYGLSGGNNCSKTAMYSTCVTSWIHLSQNDAGAPSAAEWTMSRAGYSTTYGTYRAWFNAAGGDNGLYDLITTFSARPVFFLTPDVSYISGTGTLSDPFIIQ